MSVLIDVVLIVLAASHLVDLWFNGSILAIPRAYVEARWESSESVAPLWVELLSCWYCLTHWAVIATAFLYWVIPALLPMLGLVAQRAVVVIACIRCIALIQLSVPKRVQFERGKSVT